MADIAPPVPLTAKHELQSFKNGVYPELGDWLAKHALPAQKSGSARTFVVCKKDCVVGYFALTLKSIKPRTQGGRITRGMPAYEIPCVLLARLAIHEQYQKKGLGRSLMIDALQRVLAVSEEAGTRALLVRPIAKSMCVYRARQKFRMARREECGERAPQATNNAAKRNLCPPHPISASNASQTLNPGFQSIGAKTFGNGSNAIDERAARFYEHFGFDQLDDDPLTRYMLIKDLRKTLAGYSGSAR